MKGIVVLPNFNRPEFLHVCLEHILKADESDSYTYLFCFDYGFDTQLNTIYEEFPLEKYRINMDRHLYSPLSKQSRNVLNGFCAAAEISTEQNYLVHLIEDDIFVGRDYFTFHEKLHEAEPDLFCSILSANNNTQYDVSNDENSYYISDKPDYQSLGVCYEASVIREYLFKHHNKTYYFNPEVYCTSQFPNSIIGRYYVEQDGLIRRELENSNKNTAFAHVPRCYHAGFYGNNRGKYQRGSLQARIKHVKEVCFSDEAMRRAVDDEAYYNDSKPVNLNTKHTKLKHKPCQIS